MQYHLDTIPVWSAMEEQSECPICSLYQLLEQQEIERSLGGSVMEPDVRIRVNEKGFCQKHQQMLFLQKNRLGHALMADSRSKELLKKLEKLEKKAGNGNGNGNGLKGWFAGNGNGGGPNDALIEELERLSSSCIVCETVEGHMDRYLYTFLHLWKTEKKFRDMWEASKGVCMPHTAELLRHGGKHLSAAQQKEFAASLIKLLKSNLEENEKDLEWFTLKFDYRNQDKPWGNSKNALERTVNRLRGKCLGDENGKK